jgi:hypothetical protein
MILAATFLVFVASPTTFAQQMGQKQVSHTSAA